MHKQSGGKASGVREVTAPLAPGPAIIVILLLTLFLTLESAPTIQLVPRATVIMPAMQVAIFLLLLPTLRVRLTGISPLMLLLWLALFAWSLFSIFWSGYAPHSLGRCLLVYCPSLFLLLLIYADPRPLETFWSFARGFIFFGTVLAAVALLLLTLGKVIPIDRWELQVLGLGPFKLAQAVYFKGSWPLVSSLTGNPNTLAAWLMASLILTRAMHKARRLSTIQFLLVGGLQGIVMLLTLSRTGLGATLLGLVLFWVLSAPGEGSRFARGYLVAVGGIVGVATGLAYLFDPGRAGLMASSLSGRWALWEAAWRAFQNRPVAGCGFGVASDGMLRDLGLSVVHLHNVYFSILVEIGLVGFFLFMGFWLLGAIAGGWRALDFVRSGKRDGGLALATAGSLLVALLLHQVFESMILRTNFYTILWIYLAGFVTHPLVETPSTLFSRNKRKP